MSERHTDKSGDSIMTIDISKQHLQSGIKKQQQFTKKICHWNPNFWLSNLNFLCFDEGYH